MLVFIYVEIMLIFSLISYWLSDIPLTIVALLMVLKNILS